MCKMPHVVDAKLSEERSLGDLRIPKGPKLMGEVAALI
jgi:hypothetical protein